jgi:hypothetical protein
MGFVFPLSSPFSFNRTAHRLTYRLVQKRKIMCGEKNTGEWKIKTLIFAPEGFKVLSFLQYSFLFPHMDFPLGRPELFFLWALGEILPSPVYLWISLRPKEKTIDDRINPACGKTNLPGKQGRLQMGSL